MSKEKKHISQRLLEQYAEWFHAEKQDKQFGDRQEEPTIQEFITHYAITEDINDFIRAADALNNIGLYIQLDGKP